MTESCSTMRCSRRGNWRRRTRSFLRFGEDPGTHSIPRAARYCCCSDETWRAIPNAVNLWISAAPILIISRQRRSLSILKTREM
ncbi:hypothetical protein ARMSODRAFT_79147 [Armillaria solidipes]|uniref:Uncharacterized protein n=1 Tax=Armillaria solidipes TaxID=1076256 RepID=A0A2H3B383_9AGAR|nr:hypothetical protein ARMSODRAFT_79147 [Armillaria solidipes]